MIIVCPIRWLDAHRYIGERYLCPKIKQEKNPLSII